MRLANDTIGLRVAGQGWMEGLRIIDVGRGACPPSPALPWGGGRARSLYATPPSPPPPPPPGFRKIVVPGRPPTSVPRENCPAPKAPIFFSYYVSMLKILKIL